MWVCWRSHTQCAFASSTNLSCVHELDVPVADANALMHHPVTVNPGHPLYTADAATLREHGDGLWLLLALQNVHGETPVRTL